MDGDRKDQAGPSFTSLSAAQHALVLSVNFLGFAGGILIVYGVLLVWTGWKYPPLEIYAKITAEVLTLLGVILTAASIYRPPSNRPPANFSIFVSAPLVILCAVIALAMLFFLGDDLPNHVINGFALLGLAGGLFRTIARG